MQYGHEYLGTNPYTLTPKSRQTQTVPILLTTYHVGLSEISLNNLGISKKKTLKGIDFGFRASSSSSGPFQGSLGDSLTNDTNT